MGTRADLYVGRGKQAEWLGSFAFDGYPDKPGHANALLAITDEAEYRAAVEKLLSELDHATRPVDGWPWPWNDSRGSDYAYAFDEGRVWWSCFGHEWVPGPKDDWYEGRSEEERDAEKYHDTPEVDFPDMTERQNVTFGRRSGLIVLSVNSDGTTRVDG